MTRIGSTSPYPFLGWEFGSFGPLWIREEQFHWDLPRPVRILFASDLHLGHWWTRNVPVQFMEAVRFSNPECVILGGDLIDSPDALPELAELVERLAKFSKVGGLPGNHDRCVPENTLREAFQTRGGAWLPEDSLEEIVRVEGKLNAPREHSLHDDANREHMPRIFCTHYPNQFPEALKAGYRLVLAGHLHGGQCVLATRHERLFPAYWFDRWHRLADRRPEGTLLVSRGMGDTFPFRFRCPREVLLCRFT